MKYIFSLLISIVSSLNISAQQNHFLYFQTENKQPFYVKLDNKIFSSSSAGYLIVSKLKEGNYTITFGFPKNEWPEEKISFKVNKDAGYILKNFEEKGWGVFNLQSFDVIMPGDEITKNNKPVQENKDDAFSNMLATVVNDSTIRQKDIVIEEAKEIPVLKIIDSTENPITSQEIPVSKITDSTEKLITSQESIQISADTPVLISMIRRSLLQKNKDGIEMIYTDEFNKKKDTIRIFMPAELSNEINESKEVKEIEIARMSNQTDTIKNIPPAILNEPAVEKQTADTTKYIFIEDKKDSVSAKSPSINSNCNGYASEDDFLKLRKKMAAENNNEEMIKVAKKFFRSKCFTTDYIKNLSSLFLSDDGKYNFFDAAYPFVADSGLYYTLENQLSDTYYINRFKAMIHH